MTRWDPLLAEGLNLVQVLPVGALAKSQLNACYRHLWPFFQYMKEYYILEYQWPTAFPWKHYQILTGALCTRHPEAETLPSTHNTRLSGSLCTQYFCSRQSYCPSSNLGFFKLETSVRHRPYLKLLHCFLPSSSPCEDELNTHIGDQTEIRDKGKGNKGKRS